MTGFPEKIPVGISSCLLGEQVRYDGGHKHDPLINTQLAKLFEFRPCCPEVAIGLGIPREPIQLVQTDHGIRVREVDNPDIDVTRLLAGYGSRVAKESVDICGFIFKARSPSCGPAGVTLWSEHRSRVGEDGTGVFAAALIRAISDLPVTDEGRLQDPVLCAQFVAAVRAWHAGHRP